MRLFSLDTAFMFIIGGLLTIKVLQARHPDINCYAYIAYVSFAVVILLTLIGIVRTNLFIILTVSSRTSTLHMKELNGSRMSWD